MSALCMIMVRIAAQPPGLGNMAACTAPAPKQSCFVNPMWHGPILTPTKMMSCQGKQCARALEK